MYQDSIPAVCGLCLQEEGLPLMAPGRVKEDRRWGLGCDGVYLTESICGCGCGWLRSALMCVVSSLASWLWNGYVGRQRKAKNVSGPIPKNTWTTKGYFRFFFNSQLSSLKKVSDIDECPSRYHSNITKSAAYLVWQSVKYFKSMTILTFQKL